MIGKAPTMPDYKLLSDQELITLLKTGEKNAFAEIYDRYGLMIYYKVNQILRDEESAKDLVQDLFMSVWNKPENIRADTNLPGYLYIASRNRVFKLIEKGKVRNDYLTEISKFSSEISNDTIERLDERELMMLVAQEVARLPSKMREVFQLSRIKDLSHKEIALKLNISDKTVRKQIQNALQILRSRLKPYGPYGIILLAWFRQH